MGILNNYKTNQLTEDELIADLERIDLSMDNKTLVTLELVRRRLVDAISTIKQLDKSIAKLEKTMVAIDAKNERLQMRILWLTVIGVIFTATQVVQVIDIINRW